MTDDDTRARHLRRLREVLAEHLGPEDATEVVEIIATPEAAVTITELGETGMRTYPAAWMPSPEPEEDE